MKIRSAEFIKSCVSSDQYPKGRLPEVAFVGRSNVGKSSAINTLMNHKGLAKVGKIPGKTQMVNFFRVTTTTALRWSRRGRPVPPDETPQLRTN